MGWLDILRSFSVRGPRRFPRRITLELLEERIVLDAAVDATAHVNPDQHVDNAPQASDSHSATPDSASTSGASAGSGGSTQAASSPVVDQGKTATAHTPDTPVVDQGNAATAAASGPLQVMFHPDVNVILVADSIGSADLIGKAATPNAVVIAYDGAHGNLESITDTLSEVVQSQNHTIDHLALVTHGADGRLDLSDGAVYTASTVESSSAQWGHLGSLLSQDARIDLYGCNVGRGEPGSALVNALAKATGVTVWASDDTTGTGGSADWDLEVRSGAGDMPYLLDGSGLGALASHLAGPTIVNGSFESNYDGWTMIDHPLLPGWTPTNHCWGWLSTFGIAHNNEVLLPGAFLDLNDPTKVLNPYNDYADQLGTIWGTTGVPQYTPGLEYQPFTATDGTKVAYLLQTYCANQQLYQTITLDAGAESLQWDMRYTNFDKPGFVDDGGDPGVGNHDQFVAVSLYDSTGTSLLTDLHKTTAGDPQNIGMSHFSADVTAYQGQTVRLVIEVAAEKSLLSTAFDNFVVHNAPITTGLPNLTVVEDAANSVINLADHFTDAETAHLTYTIEGNTNPALFASTTLGGTHSDQLTLDYAANMYGTSQITVKAADSDPLTSDVTSTFTVRVEPVYDAPTAAYSGGDVKVYPLAYDNVITLNGYDPDMPDPGSVSFKVTLHTPDPAGAVLWDAAPVVHDGHGNYTQQWGYYFETAFPPPQFDLVGYQMVTGAPGQYLDSHVESLVHPQVPPIPAGLQDPASVGVAVGDLNADGWNDLVVAQHSSGFTTYHLNDPSAGEYNGLAQGIRLTGAKPANAVELGDINNDGRPDLLVATDTVNQYFLNRGGVGGSFLGFDSGHDLGTGTGITRAIALTDLNGDGWLDVVAATDAGLTTKVYLNKGDAGSDADRFNAAVSLGTETPNSYAVTVGDINGDSRPDIVVGNQGANALYYLNQGSGTFGPAHTLAGSSGTSSTFALADLNHDNHLDLVVGNNGQPNKYFLNSGGTGGSWLGFDGGHDLGTAMSTKDIHTADVNGDGWQDIVAGNDGQTNTVYYAQTSGGVWTGFASAAGVTPTATPTSAIAVADINHDGWVDIVNMDPAKGGIDRIYFNGTHASNTAIVYITDPLRGGDSVTGMTDPSVSNGAIYESAVPAGSVETGHTSQLQADVAPALVYDSQSAFPLAYTGFDSSPLFTTAALSDQAELLKPNLL